MLNNQKYIVDYSPLSPFKGIRILFDHFEEGINYAQEHNIKDVCIWSGTNNKRQTVNFDLLKEKNFITTFHFIVPLSKSSSINGIYHLNNLRNFRWGVDNTFEIDFKNLQFIEELNISYNSKLSGWNSLNLLKELYIQSIKTSDCTFLSKICNLEKLRVINGNFISLHGLEMCQHLKELTLIKCPSIVDITQTINSLKKLEYLSIEKCKNVILKKEELSIAHISVI